MHPFPNGFLESASSAPLAGGKAPRPRYTETCPKDTVRTLANSFWLAASVNCATTLVSGECEDPAHSAQVVTRTWSHVTRAKPGPQAGQSSLGEPGQLCQRGRLRKCGGSFIPRARRSRRGAERVPVSSPARAHAGACLEALHSHLATEPSTPAPTVMAGAKLEHAG